jgi:hypothetical protein
MGERKANDCKTFNNYFLSAAETKNAKNTHNNNVSHLPATTHIQYLLQNFTHPSQILK